jgi:hypothetical protein
MQADVFKQWGRAWGCRPQSLLLLVIACLLLMTGTSQAGSPHLPSPCNCPPPSPPPPGDGNSGTSFLGAPVNLSTLLGGQSVSAGDKIFSGFFFSGSVDPRLVTITPIQDINGFGIRLNGPINAVNSMIDDVIFGYTVTVVTNPPHAVSSVHQRFDGFIISSGSINMTESVSTPTLVFLGQTQLFANPATNQVSDALALGIPRQQLIISNHVVLTANTLGAAASVLDIDQTFSQVLVNEIPEPSTVALLASGLLGLCLFQRHVRRRI